MKHTRFGPRPNQNCRSGYGCQLLPATLLLAMSAGCGDAADPQTFGRVVYEMPNVPGTEQPYRLPELEDARSGSAADVPATAEPSESEKPKGSSK